MIALDPPPGEPVQGYCDGYGCHTAFSFVGTGINSNGQITGYVASPYTSYQWQVHAVYYENGVLQDIGTLVGLDSIAYAINDNGVATGASMTAGNGGWHVFTYSNGTFQDINLSGVNSAGYAINNSGQITGRYQVGIDPFQRNMYHAFIYTNGALQDIGTLGGYSSVGLGINSQGQVVGYSGFGGAAHAFLFSDGQLYDLNNRLLNQSWFRLEYATGINDYGQIVGYGYPTYADALQTNEHAFLLTPTVVLPTSQIATTASGLAYSRASQTFNGTVKITNISGGTIVGPFQIVLNSLTTNVTLANATGNFSGTPYLNVPNLASLAPGQSATVSVKFSDPSNAPIKFTPAVYAYSGSPN